MLPQILSKSTTESDVPSPIIHVIPNISSLPDEKEISKLILIILMLTYQTLALILTILTF